MAVTTDKPYDSNNPYKRRFTKKDSTNQADDQNTDGTEDTNSSETKSISSAKPMPPSSFSSDAIKRRLAKDKYSG